MDAIMDICEEKKIREWAASFTEVARVSNKIAVL